MTPRPASLDGLSPSSELVLIGADDWSGLAAEVNRIATFLKAAPSAPLGDIALTTGIAARDARLVAALVVESSDDLARKLKILGGQLESSDRPQVSRRDIYLPVASAGEGGRIAFVFPGEGSQYPHMLRNICMSVPECLSAFDEADAACISAGGTAPSRWIFPPGMVDEDVRNSRISVAEGAMAVLAADVAYMRLLSRIGLKADGAVGVGIGEIAALEYAGVCRFTDRRSRLLALSEGYAAMRETADVFDSDSTHQFSVSGISSDSFRAIVAGFGDSARISRILAADKFGVCVRADSAPALSRALSEAGGVVRQLPYSRPFHTSWFERAVPALAKRFAGWFVQAPSIPVYSCIAGDPLPCDIEALRATSLAQWSSPVDFVSAINRMEGDGFRLFIEVGARSTLSSCIDSLFGGRPHLAVPMNRVHRGGLPQVNNALASLAAHGVRFDIEPLHAHRGTRLVDFSKPSRWKHVRAPRRVRLDTSLPLLRIDSMPPDFVSASSVGSRDVGPGAGGIAPRSAASASPANGTKFPLLLSSRIIAEDPGKSIVIRQALSCADLPVLADCALCAPGVSVTDPMRHGLPIVPLAYCAELMAEAACHLAPERFVTCAENLHVLRWITLDTARRVVRLCASASATDSDGALRVDVQVLDGSGDDGADAAPLARGSFLLSESPVALPPATDERFPDARETRLEGDGLYVGRLFAGPAMRALGAVTLVAPDGIEGVVRPGDCGEIVHGVSDPVFVLDPRMLSAACVATMALCGIAGDDAKLPLCQAIRRIDFTGDSCDASGELRLRVSACGSPGQGIGAFNASFTDSEGHAVALVHGCESRLFSLPATLRRALCSPVECLLSHALPDGVLPSLPQDVFCRVADNLPADLLDDPQELWLKAEAAMALSANEFVRWRYMGGTTSRRHEWLMGRIAAKDAVRSCLRERYGRKWAAADVMIEADDAGKPVPQGAWRRQCGAMMEVSITHNPGLVVAAAAPNAHIGIDTERCDRRLTDTFIDGAFSQEEQEVAAESGEGALALIRFWSAKEALAKALGTGLRYGASDLAVRAYDPVIGRIELEMTRLWTEVFPNMKDARVVVHTGILADSVLSLCVLPPETI